MMETSDARKRHDEAAQPHSAMIELPGWLIEELSTALIIGDERRALQVARRIAEFNVIA